MSNQNELPIVAWIDKADFDTLGDDGWCVVHEACCDPGADHCADVALTDHAAATARIAALEAKIKEQALQYLALDTQHQQALGQLEEARKDARRLDSGVILMHERDEFGEDYTVEHRGVNLRAAIDSAMAADGGGK